MTVLHFTAHGQTSHAACKCMTTFEGPHFDITCVQLCVPIQAAHKSAADALLAHLFKK